AKSRSCQFCSMIHGRDGMGAVRWAVWWSSGCTLWLLLHEAPDQAESFIFAGDGAFKLRVFDGGEKLLEFGAWMVAGGNEIAAGDERIRTNLLRGQSMEFLASEVVQREIAVAA